MRICVVYIFLGSLVDWRYLMTLVPARCNKVIARTMSEECRNLKIPVETLLYQYCIYIGLDCSVYIDDVLSLIHIHAYDVLSSSSDILRNGLIVWCVFFGIQAACAVFLIRKTNGSLLGTKYDIRYQTSATTGLQVYDYKWEPALEEYHAIGLPLPILVPYHVCAFCVCVVAISVMTSLRICKFDARFI